ALNINEVGDFKDLVQTRKTTARPRGMSSSQDGGSSGGREGGTRALRRSRRPHRARPTKIAHGIAAPCRGLQLSRTPPLDTAYVCAAPLPSGGYGYWLTREV